MTANENQQLWSAHLIAKWNKNTIPFNFILMHSCGPEIGLRLLLCTGKDNEFRQRDIVGTFTTSTVSIDKSCDACPESNSSEIQIKFCKIWKQNWLPFAGINLLQSILKLKLDHSIRYKLRNFPCYIFFFTYFWIFTTRCYKTECSDNNLSVLYEILNCPYQILPPQRDNS